MNMNVCYINKFIATFLLKIIFRDCQMAAEKMDTVTIFMFLLL